MAKKQQEIEIINPGDALRSLQAYNESVLMLVSFCENAKSSFNPQLQDMLQANIDRVKRFYKS